MRNAKTSRRTSGLSWSCGPTTPWLIPLRDIHANSQVCDPPLVLLLVFFCFLTFPSCSFLLQDKSRRGGLAFLLALVRLQRRSGTIRRALCSPLLSSPLLSSLLSSPLPFLLSSLLQRDIALGFLSALCCPLHFSPPPPFLCRHCGSSQAVSSASHRV